MQTPWWWRDPIVLAQIQVVLSIALGFIAWWLARRQVEIGKRQMDIAERQFTIQHIQLSQQPDISLHIGTTRVQEFEPSPFRTCITLVNDSPVPISISSWYLKFPIGNYDLSAQRADTEAPLAVVESEMNGVAAKRLIVYKRAVIPELGKLPLVYVTILRQHDSDDAGLICEWILSTKYGAFTGELEISKEFIVENPTGVDN
jgi:hypothetical protein